MDVSLKRQAPGTYLTSTTRSVQVYVFSPEQWSIWWTPELVVTLRRLLHRPYLQLQLCKEIRISKSYAMMMRNLTKRQKNLKILKLMNFKTNAIRNPESGLNLRLHLLRVGQENLLHWSKSKRKVQ